MKKHYLTAALLIGCMHHAHAQFKIINTTTTGAGSTVTAAPPSAASNVIIGGGTGAGGNSNTFVGQGSGVANSGNSNTFIGQGVGVANTSGGGNTFVGQGVGVVNTIGVANTFIGAWTGTANTSGNANTFLGQYCGVGNTTGSGNTFVGQNTGEKNTTAGGNVFVGKDAGQLTDVGPSNAFVGSAAGKNNKGGQGNVFMGDNTGIGNIQGSNNTILGRTADVLFSNLQNASAIGYAAQVASSNSMVLGGTGSNAVRVGIGTTSPGANLHMESNNGEYVLINNTSASLQSLINLRSGSNELRPFSNGASMSTIYLPAVTGAPTAVTAANMTGMFSRFSPMMIGMEAGYEPVTNNIHFVNNVQRGAAGLGSWECIRINSNNGFVGVHSRTAATGGGSGAPQALFHVNLTNPANPQLNTLVNGIRFEGLPTASHPDVIVIDANGNLAKRAYPSGSGGGGPYWTLAGNVTGTADFIGTLNADDFRFRTNNLQRGSVTVDGNFDFGANSFTATSTSGAFGLNNSFNAVASSFATGKDNAVSLSSDFSVAMGDGNQLSNAPQAFAAGYNNTITNSPRGCIALGARNQIFNTNESTILGEANTMSNGHGCFIGGGHSTTDGAYNVALGDRLATTGNTLHAYGSTINNNLDRSIVMGFENNRTSVLTSRGLAVQLDPNGASTYAPTVNFEAQAGVSVTAPLPISIVRSNARLHNLPPTKDPYPHVIIDPSTGELFMADGGATPGLKMGIEQSGKTLQPIPGALELIQKIEPQQTTPGKPAQGKESYGVRSENMESVLPAAVGNMIHTGKDGKPETVKGIDYTELVPVLIQGIKDQQEQIKTLQAQVSTQQSKIDELVTIVSSKNAPKIDIALSDKDAIRLDQSTPNPADKFTSIGYYIPATIQSAEIRFSNMEGKMIRSMTITERGAGVVNIYLSDLSQGMYTYTLIADGKLIDTKKMVVTR